MRIALFNVKYSPNLGDGLLSECLEREIAEACEDCQVASIDLAGRTRYGDADSSRRLKLKLLEALPASLRTLVARLALSRLVDGRLRPQWRKALRDVDGVVIGGGNLFADADLNFPMKIAGALAEVHEHQLPVAVFGVGVTSNWSPRGKHLFGKALSQANLVSATVRDVRSRAAWRAMLDGWPVASTTIALDPGLLASRHYPAASRPADGRTVAFGITDPVAVRYHATDRSGGHDLAAWYADGVAALAATGLRVTLFTNGSPEDVSFLTEQSVRLIGDAADRVTVATAFADPGELATFLSGQSLVVAHRMHACIAAHSFGVPTIGLAWDVKLASFFELCGRAGFMADPEQVSASDLAALAQRAIAKGIDAAALSALIATARTDVETLVATLTRVTARATISAQVVA